MHCCIFDYDGTLIDSPQITMITLQDIARRRGMRVPSLKELRDLWHLPWEEILWNVWATENNAVSVLFNEEHPKIRFKPYPGAKRLLTSLAQKNVLLALVTNRDEESLCYTAETTGINLKHFDVLDAIDGRRYHKPDPRVFNRTWAALENTGIRRENTYVVGDSIGDLEASRGFGFPFIAFPTYVTKATTFRALGVPNSHILTDLQQLRQFV
ncbi:MAG: HAD hydrolase-like protein [bacterium]|nr:HAD hydrolase-like protein [bacterium]